MILIDSSHHAREAVSLSMVLAVFLKELIGLVHDLPGRGSVYRDVALLLYPAVNVDSVLAINKDFFGTKEKRKNSKSVGCSQYYNDGVDPNRNYDI